jgi:DNA modification methylase
MSEIAMPTQIVLREVATLLPYARNARLHDDAQVANIASSMKEFGFTNPVLIADDTILAGHGRVMAANLLKLKVVPTIDLSHLSPTQRKAYVLADNKIALNSTYDLDMLRVELEELQAEGFDLGITGFGLEEISDLLTPEELPPSDKDPDALPEVPEEPHSKPGDVWILGPHRLMCGDSTMIDHWDTLMAGERADMVWTDPPYNVAYESKLAGAIKNDDMGDANFHQFLLDAYTSLFAVMKPGAAIYVAHADTEGYNFRSAFLKAGFKLSGCLIWEKDSLVLGRSDYQWMHEPILYGWKPGNAHRWFGGRKQTTVAKMGEAAPFEQQPDGRWVVRAGGQTFVVSGDAMVEQLESSVIYHEKPARSALHPTTKPVSLITKFLRNNARHNDIIVDAFGGSGSTLIAAEMMGMCARLMELDGRFADVICARYHGFTGRLPVHALTGEPFPVAVADKLNAK